MGFHLLFRKCHKEVGDSMARLPGYRRIILEDYPEKDRDLIGKLAVSLNQPLEEIIAVFNKNISLNDNLNQVQKVITVTVDGSGIPTRNTNIVTDLATQCTGTQVIKAVNITTSTNSPTTHPFITFTNNTGFININKITGLQANETYQLTVIFYPL
jgi:hypothetical protein